MLRYHLNLLTFWWSQDIPKLQSVSQIKITLCVFLTSQLLLGFFFHLSIELYLIVEHVPNRLCSGLGLTLSVSV